MRGQNGILLMSVHSMQFELSSVRCQRIPVGLHWETENSIKLVFVYTRVCLCICKVGLYIYGYMNTYLHRENLYLLNQYRGRLFFFFFQKG